MFDYLMDLGVTQETDSGREPESGDAEELCPLVRPIASESACSNHTFPPAVRLPSSCANNARCSGYNTHWLTGGVECLLLTTILLSRGSLLPKKHH